MGRGRHTHVWHESSIFFQPLDSQKLIRLSGNWAEILSTSVNYWHVTPPKSIQEITNWHHLVRGIVGRITCTIFVYKESKPKQKKKVSKTKFCIFFGPQTKVGGHRGVGYQINGNLNCPQPGPTCLIHVKIFNTFSCLTILPFVRERMYNSKSKEMSFFFFLPRSNNSIVKLACN